MRRRPHFRGPADVIHSASALVNYVTNVCKSPYFSPETMRYFRSRLSNKVYPSPKQGATYFVTSEKGPDMRRRYSVGRVRDCRTERASKFQAYATSAQAHRAAAAFAEGWGDAAERLQED